MTAMPSAYPNSLLVWTTPEAEPAFSGDTELITTLVPRATIGPLLPYYHQHRTGRGLVVSITGNVGRSRDLETLVEHHSRLLKDAGWFRIWREPPPGPPISPKLR